MEIIPANSEVFTTSSITLNALGLTEEIDKSGRYDSARAKLVMMDRKTQNREMMKLGARPEYMIGSVHAVTETGQVIIVSKIGSQLAGYAAGAARVNWVVGTQKIVATLEAGLKRVEEYALPLGSARMLKARGVYRSIDKVLIVNKEFMPGRTPDFGEREPGVLALGLGQMIQVDDTFGNETQEHASAQRYHRQYGGTGQGTHS